MISTFQELLDTAITHALSNLDAKSPLALTMASTKTLAGDEPMDQALVQGVEVALLNYPGITITMYTGTYALDTQVKKIASAVLLQEMLRDRRITDKIASLGGTVNPRYGTIDFSSSGPTVAERAANWTETNGSSVLHGPRYPK